MCVFFFSICQLAIAWSILVFFFLVFGNLLLIVYFYSFKFSFFFISLLILFLVKCVCLCGCYYYEWFWVFKSFLFCSMYRDQMLKSSRIYGLEGGIHIVVSSPSMNIWKKNTIYIISDNSNVYSLYIILLLLMFNVFFLSSFSRTITFGITSILVCFYFLLNVCVCF